MSVVFLAVKAVQDNHLYVYRTKAGESTVLPKRRFCLRPLQVLVSGGGCLLCK